MQSRFRLCLLASIATLASFVRADYYIDDQNYTSLLYSESPAGAKWGPFQEGGETLFMTLANGTVMTIDASHCYNYTYTYAACTIADNCQVQIPFSGSGIAIYVLQAGQQGINASLTIDGGKPTYTVLDAPPGPNFYVPNVTLFSIQGMNTGNHTATMAVLNWDNIFSGMMFDYAFINQTIVSTSVTGASSGGLASPTALATAIPETSVTAPMSGVPAVLLPNVGAIVGGVLGGLTALILIILAILYFRRRYRKVHESHVDDHGGPMVEPFVAGTRRPSVRYTTVSGHTTGENTATVNTQSPTQSTSSPSSRPDKSLLSVTTSMGHTTGPNILSAVQGAPSSTHTSSEMSQTRIQQSYPALTDDQADFVNSLYANNVPAAAIARVIERMMAGELRPAVDGYDSLPPPSYYHSTNDG